MALVTWECRHKGCGYKRQEQETLKWVSHMVNGEEHMLHKRKKEKS